MQYVGHYTGVSPISAFAYNASGLIWNGAAYVAPVDADIATYRIATTTDDSGSLYATLPANAARYETRKDAASFPLSELIWEDELPTVFDAEWASFVRAQVALITAGSATPATDTPGVFGDTLEAETDCRYVKSLVLPGVDITDWEALVFTIKQRLNEDDDGEALLAVRVTNPAAPATDGILVHRRALLPAGNALRSRANIIVDAVSPDAQLTIVLNADALDLPASPDNQPYTYEIDVYANGDKEQRGKGDFKLSQSVRRSAAIP